ncbi:MAG: TonB-dependent receptor [Flavobacteriaceae bacterium]
MKLKVFSLLLIVVPILSFGQNVLKGRMIVSDSLYEKESVEVYEKGGGYLQSFELGSSFELAFEVQEVTLFFVATSYPIVEKTFFLDGVTEDFVEFPSRIQNLSEIVIQAQKREQFELTRLEDYIGTSIYAGKKNEVINIDQSMANLAVNNSRQVYSQVAGLNIYENDDAGLQLHIGGRGLDPNRTSNFNTRQNGYDISADVLGYPESYYAPPAEALREIQILRGAASLQYGTQFGGLVNFIFKEANPEKPFDLTIRNTLGSNQLFTNFTSANGTIGKLSYMTFFNLKQGNGFRANSKSNSSNYFLKLGYEIDKNSSVSAEVTYLKYLAQQAGGLTDAQFFDDPFQSNRSRNWFELDWLLYRLEFKHSFSEKSTLSFNFFGLDAVRNALGFRSNRVNQNDPMEERDLIKGDFKNFGTEARWINKYSLRDAESVWLLGIKYYKSNNTSSQGPGSSGRDADFSFKNDLYPYYNFQSSYEYPNENIAFFTENIFYPSDRFSITPGARFEYIKTQSDGFYKRINRDAAGNVIFDQSVFENDLRSRAFVLLGLGASYKVSESLEAYLNISQNYRSVTFSDISIFNPSYTINPNITDEKGFTADVGFRGVFKNYCSYDFSFFNLGYNNRIGFVQRVLADGNVKSERGNVGDAQIYGAEALLDFNLKSLIAQNKPGFILNYFLNASFIDSQYTRSIEAGVEGKKVEFVPNQNFKTGLKIGYKNMLMNLQYSYLSRQFTDSSNAVNGNISGLIGVIPTYEILDFSSSFLFNHFKIEAGINNLLNARYFTRRATGYPGPGIIPAAPRTFYLTLQYKL